jgi:type I restriction enzyme R subunit
VREFNPRYAQAEGALLGKLSHFHTDIYGNWNFRFPPFVLR